MAALSISGLEKNYHGKPVLRGIDWTLEAGRIAALVGPSGCGKTSLLRCIIGLEPFQAGRVEVDGHGWGPRESELYAQGRSRPAAHLGFVFQDFQLFPHLTALENVALALRVVQKKSEREARSQAQRALEKVGLAALAGQRPGTLSGGQKQRVALARALALAPQLLLYDEPTSALDAANVQGVTELMRQLGGEGITQIVVTHDLDFARKVSDEIVHLENGRIV